ncbi:hypothetical protein [Sorangium sp. So ce426]
MAYPPRAARAVEWARSTPREEVEARPQRFGPRVASAGRVTR